MASISQRILTLLQFTRFALVFTAISNAQASILLSTPGSPEDWAERLDGHSMLWMALVSVGLYGFGMSLNDIIDRRRDAQLASDRPLPSGRIGIGAAHGVATLLLLLALCGGAMLSLHGTHGSMTPLLICGVVVLILFYDFAGKYLVPLGLISLGLIRFFHAAIAAPSMPVPWHPLLLLNHVTILSTVAYAWEQKRPALSRRHVVIVATGLFAFNAAIVGVLLVRRLPAPGDWTDDLHISPALLWPTVAVVLFGWVAAVIYQRHADRRAAGKSLMLIGLLWLIVYDAAFVAGYVHWLPAVVLLSLLPLAWVCVRLVRGWVRLVELSEKPGYIRAR